MSSHHPAVRRPAAFLTACGMAFALILPACSDESSGPSADGLAIAPAPTAAGDKQAALRGTVLPQPLRVQVSRDGSPVEGAQVAWEVLGDAGGAVSGNGPTDEDGIATATWTVGAAGLRLVTARLDADRSTNFSATVEPATLEVVSGNGQGGVVGTELAEPVVVRVHYLGQPLAGEMLEAFASDRLGTVTVNGPTSEEGLAHLSLELGTMVGEQGVRVRSIADAGMPRSLTLSATATAGPTASTGTFYPGTLVAGLPSTAAYVQVWDQFGNLAAGGQLDWRIVSGAEGPLVAPAADAWGYASVTVVARASDQFVVLAARVPGQAEELVLDPIPVWDGAYYCPWECYLLMPEVFERSAGTVIRFLKNTADPECRWAEPPAGLGWVVTQEFSIATPGSYTFTCPGYGSPESRTVRIVP